MLKTQILCSINNYILGKNRFCVSTESEPVWNLKGNRKKYVGNKVAISLCECKRTIFEIKGNHNQIQVGEISRLHYCHIAVVGSNNVIMVGSNCGLYGLNIVVAGDGCEVLIGDDCNFFCHQDFKGYLATGDGAKVVIGKGCLFAPGFLIRADDGHSIFEAGKSGYRINHAQDIIIGDHVWIGAKTMVLKGVFVGDGCVIGGGTLLTKGTYGSNMIWAGNPVRKVRENITWEM